MGLVVVLDFLGGYGDGRVTGIGEGDGHEVHGGNGVVVRNHPGLLRVVLEISREHKGVVLLVVAGGFHLLHKEVPKEAEAAGLVDFLLIEELAEGVGGELGVFCCENTGLDKYG